MSVKNGLVATTAFIGGVGVLVLAGCSTFGTNVSGNFSCRAADGICSPTSAIDDQALAQISGTDGDLRVPVGNFAGGEAGDTRVASSAPPPSGKALKIVLPGRVDRFGRKRSPQIVYASVDGGGGDVTASVAGVGRLSLVELASAAPTFSETHVAVARGASRDPSRMNEVVRQAYQSGLGGPPVATTDGGFGVSVHRGSNDAPVEQVSSGGETVVSGPSFTGVDTGEN